MSFFKFKGLISTSRPLESIYMDLFGSTRTISLGEKKYGFIIIDEFAHFTYVLFLTYKDKAFLAFLKFYHVISNKKISIICIHSDNGNKFEVIILKVFVMRKASITFHFAPIIP